MGDFMIIFLGIFWFVSAIICALIASNKNRSVIGWFFAGLFFGIIAIIIIALNDSKHDNDYKLSDNIDEKMFICNKCGNKIIINKNDLKNVDIVVCATCQNEIPIKPKKKEKTPKEEKANDNYIDFNCPKCGNELHFNKETINSNSYVECPYCNSKIKTE